MKRFLGICLIVGLVSCHSKQYIQSHDTDRYAVKDSITGFDSKIEQKIAPYREGMEAEMNVVIGNCEKTLPKERNLPESDLGNWVADIVYTSGFSYIKKQQPNISENTIFTLINKGGLRSSLNEGEVTKGNIFELMPFDNEIVIVKLTPVKIKKMIHYLFMNNGQPVSNAVFYLSSDKGQVHLGGRPYNFDEDVYVITSDYLAKGGDKMTFFNGPLEYIQTGILIRDAILSSVMLSKRIIAPENNNRIQFVK